MTEKTTINCIDIRTKTAKRTKNSTFEERKFVINDGKNEQIMNE